MTKAKSKIPPWLDPIAEKEQEKMDKWLQTFDWKKSKFGSPIYAKLVSGYSLCIAICDKGWTGFCDQLGVEILLECPDPRRQYETIIRRLETACLDKIAQKIGYLDIERQKLMTGALEMERMLKSGI